jgi:hypothetical protein
MKRLGHFSREVVCERYSLAAAARKLEGIYERLIEEPPRRSPALRDGISIASLMASRKAKTTVVGSIRRAQYALFPQMAPPGWAGRRR